ncbi:MAG: polysaccharide deacetylase family protein [Candidatus Omnitrophota bacterium]
MNKKRFCAISVDLDSVYHYLDARGYMPKDCTNLNAVYDEAVPRFLDIFDQYGVKATFFVVGADAIKIANKSRVREIFKRGHEVANHTMNHYAHFYNLNFREKQNEIVEADKVLSDIVGEKIKGFRAPGWGIDSDALKILKSVQYDYDSSIFPSKLVVILSLANWLMNKGRLNRGMGSSIDAALSPKLPYFPSENAIWRRGKGDILELPLSVLPLIQLPFLGTVLYMLGRTFFDVSLRFFNIFRRPLLYELHGIELVDFYASVNDERLRVKPGFTRSLQEKISLYDFMLKKFSNDYSFLTLKGLERVYRCVS